MLLVSHGFVLLVRFIGACMARVNCQG